MLHEQVGHLLEHGIVGLGSLDASGLERLQVLRGSVVHIRARVAQIGTDPDAQVTVIYEHIGMGFCGNPLGPDVWPMVTVEMTGLTFDFITPFVSLASFTFPECSASYTGEDYTTCIGGGSLPC